MKRKDLKSARAYYRYASKVLSKKKKKLAPHTCSLLDELLGDLAKAIDGRDGERISICLEQADKALKRFLPKARKSAFREAVETIVIAFLIAFVLRTFVVQAFKIPTGSMQPTLLGAKYFGVDGFGDKILVNKFIYGAKTPDWIGIPFTDYGAFIPCFNLPAVRKPARGDIIVFRTLGINAMSHADQKKDFIKRLVGLPGDTVEIRGVEWRGYCPRCGMMVNLAYPRKITDENGQEVMVGRCKHWRGEDPCEVTVPLDPEWDGSIYINGEKLTDPPVFAEIPYVNAGPYGRAGKAVTVPEGHYFFLGDNSNNSRDSRYWGFVPEENIRGDAFFIYWPPKWPGWPFYSYQNRIGLLW